MPASFSVSKYPDKQYLVEAGNARIVRDGGDSAKISKQFGLKTEDTSKMSMSLWDYNGWWSKVALTFSQCDKVMNQRPLTYSY